MKVKYAMEITLNKLPLNKEGIITKLNVNPNLKRRLKDLGLINDTKIKYLFKSPFNDPHAYLIRGSIIALREEDAKKIYIYYQKDGESNDKD